MKLRIKKNDLVKIMTGKDRGKLGKVLHTFPSQGKIVVEGVNIIKKHVRPRRQGEKGQRVEIFSPFPASRAQIFCKSCNQVTRAGFVIRDKKRTRICKKCKANL